MPALLLFFTLLLQAAPAQSADGRFADWAVRLAPLALSIYIYLQAPSRETQKKRDKDIADLLTWKELQQALNTQHQLAMEKIGDEVKRNHQEHEVKLGQLSEMKTDVAVMKNQLQGQVESLRELNNKMDRLLHQNGK
jgi:hypothetical protein